MHSDGSEVQAQAQATPRTRTEIKESTDFLAKRAERYNLTEATVRKWRSRESPEDFSHRPREKVLLHRRLLWLLCSIAMTEKESLHAQL